MEEAVHGVVRVGSTDTPYVRTGRGAPVLLLLAGAREAAAADEIFLCLSEGFRVFAVLLDLETARGSRAMTEALPFLRDLVEALGLRRPLVVAERGREPLLRWLSEDEPRLFGPFLAWHGAPAGTSSGVLLQALRRAAEGPAGAPIAPGQAGAPPRI